MCIRDSPYTEPAMCANYISDFFQNDDLCIAMGKNARETALRRHDPNKNVKNYIELYEKMIGV